MKIKHIIFQLIVLSFFACKKESVDESTNGKTTAQFNQNLTYGTLTDQEGNIYKTITVGGKTWMAENLRTRILKDGTTITIATEKAGWINATTAGYCNPCNTKRPDSIATYGRLYNWYAVNTGKLAPDGWHVASLADWEALFSALGGKNLAATKLLETGTLHWNGTNPATNTSGMTIVPAGYRDFSSGGFINFLIGANFWTSTSNNATNAERVYFNINDSKAYSYNGGFNYGFSVRCVKN